MQIMNILNTLAFVSTGNVYSLVERRRIKMVDRLREQIALTEGDLTSGHPPILRVQRNRVTHPETGAVSVIERSVPVRPWWKTAADGQIILTVRHGMRKVEFQKGKSGILVSSMDELPNVLQGLIDATVAGELDQFMDGVSEDQDKVPRPDTSAPSNLPPERPQRSSPAKKGR